MIVLLAERQEWVLAILMSLIATALRLKMPTALSSGMAVITGIGLIVTVFCAFFLALHWNAFKKHGPFYCSLIILGVWIKLPKDCIYLYIWTIGIFEQCCSISFIAKAHRCPVCGFPLVPRNCLLSCLWVCSLFNSLISPSNLMVFCSCLFIKTWALYQVWRNAKNFQRSTLTPSYILKGILLYMALEVVSF